MKLRRNILKNISLSIISLILLNIDALQAEEFHVTTGEDFIDALILVSKNGEADTIWLNSGTYNTGSYYYSPEEGEDYSLTIQGKTGTTANDVIIEGNGEEGGLFVEQDSATINIEGITISNCGAGIKIISFGEITLTNNIIIDNANGGVGIIRQTESIVNRNVNITLTNNTITNNGGFGGVYIPPAQITDNVITLSNNTISNNHSSLGASSDGGGIYLGLWDSGTCDVSITDNTLSGNGASGNGGGVFVGPSAEGEISLTNNTITENTAPSGAGVYINSFGNVEITLTNNTITNNKTTNKGAVYGTGVNIKADSGNITLINNTISANTMKGFISNIDIPVGHGAGGIIKSVSGDISLTNNMIIGNKIEGMESVGHAGGLKVESSGTGNISLV